MSFRREGLRKSSVRGGGGAGGTAADLVRTEARTAAVPLVSTGTAAGPLARVAGVSYDQRRPWRPTDFQPDPAGLYTIAVVPGDVDLALLPTRGLHYWALGGRHDRSTPLSAGVATVSHASLELAPPTPQSPGNSPVAHYCGTPQGRRPEESGIHGCTLVQVDPQGQTRTSLIPTDAARWLGERVSVERNDDGRGPGIATPPTDSHAGRSRAGHRIVGFLDDCRAGPLLAALRRPGGTAALLDRLRGDYGYRQPAAWMQRSRSNSARRCRRNGTSRRRFAAISCGRSASCR